MRSEDLLARTGERAVTIEVGPRVQERRTTCIHRHVRRRISGKEHRWERDTVLVVRAIRIVTVGRRRRLPVRLGIS